MQQYGINGFRGPAGAPAPLGTGFTASQPDAVEFLRAPSAQHPPRHSCDLRPMDSDAFLPPRTANSFDLHQKQAMAKAPHNAQSYAKVPAQMPSSHPSTASHRSKPAGGSHRTKAQAPAGGLGGTLEARHAVHHQYPAAALAMDSALFRSTASTSQHESLPGVQTPPQVVEQAARSGSRVGSARHPQGVAENLAAYHHLQQMQGLGSRGPAGAGHKLVPLHAGLVSPFACAGINRAASTMSCGVATPDEAQSRRVSFD